MGEHDVLHRIDADNAEIEFSDQGAGEPLLLVHAGAFAAWFGGLTTDPALNRFRLVTPVRAGYDPTKPAPGHLTLADHARHCAAVLDHLDITASHVLAHSSGSLIALQLAADRPDLVRSLVLVEPAPAASLLPAQVAAGVTAAQLQLVEAATTELTATFDLFMRNFCAPDYREVLLAQLGRDGLARAE